MLRQARETAKEIRRTTTRQDVSSLGFVYNRKETETAVTVTA